MRITLEECQKFYSDWLKRGHKQRDPLPTALCKFINNQPTSDVKDSVNQRLVEALEIALNALKDRGLSFSAEISIIEQALESSKTFESKESKLRATLEYIRDNVEHEGEWIKKSCEQALEGNDTE